MKSSPSSSFHQRLSWEELEQLVPAGTQPLKAVSHVSSPVHAWSKEMNLKNADIIPVSGVPCDVLLWARGEPKNPTATKVGGIPVWPKCKTLPSEKRRFGLIPSKLRFLGQFNFLDSLDILPDLPTGLLSVWAPPEFEGRPESIKCFWLDPATVAPVSEHRRAGSINLFPGSLFHAVLYRSTDLMTEPDEKLASEWLEYMRAVEESMTDQSKPTPEPSDALKKSLDEAPDPWSTTWHGSKFGGLESTCQGGSNFDPIRFFMQLQSIQAAPSFPYPWIDHPSTLDLDFSDNGIYHKSNEFMMGDMGDLAFHLSSNGRVKTTFDSM